MDNAIRRRHFLKTSTALAAGLSGSTLTFAAADTLRDTSSPQNRTYREPVRDVPVVDEADVVVCGAGPAGVTAAIAAARAGAKTRLIEVNGCLGGVWTSGLLCWILDAGNKRGIMPEMIKRLHDRGAHMQYGGAHGYDVEQMKFLLEEMCREAGVDIRLHTRVVGAARNERRMKLAITESKSGREAFAGKVFVDASGDGDLAARAGCGFDVGHPETGQCQPMSVIVLLGGLDPNAVAPFVRGLAEPKGHGNPKKNLLEEMRRAGVEPSYMAPTMFYHCEGLFCMMANHEYGVSATNADDITAASIRGRAEVHRLVDALRSLGGPWKNVQIVVSPEYIGVREGRRIHGLYEVTVDDLIQGARHEDGVCRVKFGVDIHSIDPKHSKAIVTDGIKAKAYDIPLRALIAKDVDGLMMAGRCISGDFVAHSSYRVTGDSVVLGEAAGIAAALAAKQGCLPQDIPFAEVQKSLKGAVVSG